jgi:cytochrome oxidase Cu insertion factor (SCO1/SenC/PrrC family)
MSRGSVVFAVDSRQAKRRLIISSVLAACAAILLGGAIAVLLTRNQAASPTTSTPIEPTDRTVPQTVALIPLINQNGQATDLAAFHGRIVIMADFMTSCQEECPITTGALITIEQSLADAHLLNRVAIVEVTVDAWRDTPSRVRAYQKTFGADWTMLTGSVANLDRFWSYFGVWYQRVPESNPPNINWEKATVYVRHQSLRRRVRARPSWERTGHNRRRRRRRREAPECAHGSTRCAGSPGFERG